MGSMVHADVRPVARPGPGATNDPVRLWLLPSPAPVDDGAFDRALRAASLAWQPRRIEPAEPPVAAGPVIGLPEVLEAWRATERELAGMTVDDPNRALLDANVLLLRAMYQRLYRERMQR
jgi:hypothetical protein